MIDSGATKIRLLVCCFFGGCWVFFDLLFFVGFFFLSPEMTVIQVRDS